MNVVPEQCDSNSSYSLRNRRSACEASLSSKLERLDNVSGDFPRDIRNRPDALGRRSPEAWLEGVAGSRFPGLRGKSVDSRGCVVVSMLSRLGVSDDNGGEIGGARD